MKSIREDRRQMIPCPFPQCETKVHPVGTIFCPFTGNRLPSLPPNSSTDALDDTQNTFANELINLLKKTRGEATSLWRNFYIYPDIPSTLCMRETEKCPAAENQQGEILGIIDLTVWGTKKYCLVFGKHALYYHNPRFSHQPGMGTLLYPDIKTALFVPFGKFDIEIQNAENTSLFINIAVLSNSPDKKKRLLDLLNGVSQLIRTQDEKNIPIN